MNKNKIRINIGDAFNVLEKDIHDQDWSVLIIARIINYKGENRWIALKNIRKNLKMDIEDICCFFTFDDYGNSVWHESGYGDFSISHRISNKKFRKLIPDLFESISSTARTKTDE